MTLGHDANGNLNARGSQAYQYTSQNRFWNAPGQSELRADSLERIDYVAAESLLLAHDGEDVVSEVACCGTSIQRRYVFGPGEPGPAQAGQPLIWYEGSGTSDRRWLHADERGSIVAVTNDAGTVTTINKYSDYGAPDTANAGRFQYTGQKWIPSLALYDYRRGCTPPRSAGSCRPIRSALARR